MARMKDSFGTDNDPFGSSFRDSFEGPPKYTMEEMKRMVDTSWTIPDDLKELVKVEIASRAPLDARYKHEQVAFQKGVFGGKRWAIRKDDFRFIEIIAGTAVAATTFATVVTASPAVLAVTLIFAALTLVDRLRRKGAVLDDKQYELIVALKALGPTTVEKLAETATGLHIFGRDVWSEETTLAALNELKAVHLGDGTTEALVTQAANGVWAVNGL